MCGSNQKRQKEREREREKFFKRQKKKGKKIQILGWMRRTEGMRKLKRRLSKFIQELCLYIRSFLPVTQRRF